MRPLEDAERVTVAFLVATAALDQGKEVVIWTTKDAVRLGLPREAKGQACDGCPPLERLFKQFADAGGELWLCPICLNARGLADEEKVGNMKVAGATPMWGMGGRRRDRLQLLIPARAVSIRRTTAHSVPFRGHS